MRRLSSLVVKSKILTP